MRSYCNFFLESRKGEFLFRTVVFHPHSFSREILDFQSGEFLNVKSLEEWRNGSQQDTIVMKGSGVLMEYKGEMGQLRVD
ncbi:hypothetical protein MKW98_012176 [Papaver atlanticum]|uniref:Uncharacterized protein n=1 Tax=Papaver atlanticum TaxID=357466 RepID=A0AAD4T1H3_9MAGN|nr:hypothetical protein MKW98_012176 [Papaver atlanticum]